MIDRLSAALIATLFALFGLWVLVAYGSHGIRSAALVAALLVSIAHFVAQDPGRPARLASVCLNYLAFGLAAVAVARFAMT